MTKILVTGGDGRFAQVLKQKNKFMDLTFVSKKQCNIMNLKSIERIFQKIKPKIIFHCAALSRPMDIHNRDIIKSININIIGTANVVKVCKKLNIKIIYFSTGYVYSRGQGNYSETDAVKPFNNYAISKLGGECSVAMYKNSLILRITMTEKPFLPKKAYTNLYANFMYHEDLVEILPKILNKKGILNVGGKSQSIYNFVKITNPKIIKTKLRTGNMPLNQTMNISKLKKYLE
jgi:dTDP-4-dehydrorhamnose reductase